MTTTADIRAEIARHLGIAPTDAATLCKGDLPQGVDPATPVALGMVDPVGVQELVLTSRRPLGVNGASRTLALWDEGARNRASGHGVCLLYAGGGQSVVIGRPDAVHIWRDAEVHGYDAITHGGPVGDDVLPCRLDALARGPRPYDGPAVDLTALGVAREGGGFGALLGALAVQVAAKKSRAHALVEDHEGRRCEDSGLLRADSNKLSARCKAFNREGQRDDRWDKARSFADFVGGVAFVAIDGTRIGATLQSLRTIDAYARFSAALDAAFGRRALDRHLQNLGLNEGDYIPVMAGGDDLVFAVDARAFPDGPLALVHALLRRIGASYDAACGDLDRIGAGAGLVVGDGVHARMALDLARSLVKSAKTLQKGRGLGEARFAVDFEYLSNGAQASTSVEVLRRTRVRGWTPPGATEEALFRLHRRPFSLDASERLDAIADRVLRGEHGRRLLYQLRAGLEEPMVGLVDAVYLLARNPIDGLDAANLVGGSLDGVDHALISDDKIRLHNGREERVFSSAIPDLVEMATLRARVRRGREE